MVATAELRQRIDLDLHVVRLKIEDLAEIEQAWPDETRENRLMETQEWEDTIARLSSLREVHESGQMSDGQRRRYQELLRMVAGAEVRLVRLGLATPNDVARILSAEP